MELNHRRGSFPEHEAMEPPEVSIMEPGQRAGYPRGDLAAGSVPRKEPHPTFTGNIAKFQGRGLMIKGLE